jgi:Spy/CpxP family protein refolding chaperone
MSTVRTLALGALMVCGVAGVSAAQSSVTPKTRADSGYDRRGDRSDGQFRKGRGGREGFRFGRDLNLTEAQKTQIKAIRQKYQPQNQALRNRAKPFMDAARAARQKGDTAAFRSNMEQARQVMQSGQSIHTQQQAEIRAVLTAEQQAKFDAQQKAASERRAKGGKKGWGRKGPGAPPATRQ